MLAMTYSNLKNNLKNKLNSSFELGVTVSQISLVYAERDGRQ